VTLFFLLFCDVSVRGQTIGSWQSEDPCIIDDPVQQPTAGCLATGWRVGEFPLWESKAHVRRGLATTAAETERLFVVVSRPECLKFTVTFRTEVHSEVMIDVLRCAPFAA